MSPTTTATLRGKVASGPTRALQIIEQIIQLHSGHMDGSVEDTPESLKQEMDMLQAARKALKGG